MKKGEVAALDRTEALLSRFEGRVLRCRLVKGDLPPEAARDLMRRHGNDVTLRIEDADDALRKLESLKAAGAEIENLTVGQARSGGRLPPLLREVKPDVGSFLDAL